MHTPGPLGSDFLGQSPWSSEAGQVTAVQADCTARSAENNSIEQAGWTSEVWLNEVLSMDFLSEVLPDVLVNFQFS